MSALTPDTEPDSFLFEEKKLTIGRKKKIETRVIDCRHDKISAADLQYCSSVVDQGGVICFPTDTVYGIGCNAFDPAAVKKIYSIKGRSYSKPLPILLGHMEQLSLVALDVPPEALTLTKKYWPGPLTLIFKTASLALIAARGKNTIAVRVPDHGLALDLLRSAHVPLATTSANKSGASALIKGDDVVKAFRGKADVIIDGGLCNLKRESSVVDATHFPFTVLREGAISKNNLAEQLGLN